MWTHFNKRRAHLTNYSFHTTKRPDNPPRSQSYKIVRYKYAFTISILLGFRADTKPEEKGDVYRFDSAGWANLYIPYQKIAIKKIKDRFVDSYSDSIGTLECETSIDLTEKEFKKFIHNIYPTLKNGMKTMMI